MQLSYLEITARLLAAVVCGLLLGRERKLKGKPVGSRTHIIICLAATMITIISTYGFADFILNYEKTETFLPGEYRSDPARLVVGILTGIGFIGAGIIWKDSCGDIRGITTAANVYLVACLGIAIGMGMFFIAGITTFLTFCTLEYPDFIKKIKNYKNKKSITNEKNLNNEEDDEDCFCEAYKIKK